MKNIFKLMGVALIAGSMMFVACNKDENTDENNNTTPQEETIADGVSVTFDGATWTPEVSHIYAYPQLEAIQMTGYVGEGYPMVKFISYQYGVGEGHGAITSESPYFGDNDEIYSLDYWDATSLFSVSEGETTYYGDWWGKEATLNIKKFDATAMTITAVLDATLFDAMAALVNQTATLDNAPTKTLKVTMGNITME